MKKMDVQKKAKAVLVVFGLLLLMLVSALTAAEAVEATRFRVVRVRPPRRDDVVVRRWAADPNGVYRLETETPPADPNGGFERRFVGPPAPVSYLDVRDAAMRLPRPLLKILVLELQTELDKTADVQSPR